MSEEMDRTVKEVQEQHFELTDTPGKCACSLPWPCGSIQKTLADEVEQLRTLIADLREENAQMRGALKRVIANLENEPYTFAQKYSEQVLKIARAALPKDEPS